MKPMAFFEWLTKRKKPLSRMTRSELMTVMVGGFATIAGGVLAMYVGMLQEHIPGIAGHLMAASVMGAPATFVIAKVICPETETPATLGTLQIEVPRTAANVMEAFGDGVTQGLQLALNIAAMLLAFVAIMALIKIRDIMSRKVFALQGRDIKEIAGDCLSCEETTRLRSLKKVSEDLEALYRHHKNQACRERGNASRYAKKLRNEKLLDREFRKVLGRFARGA